ncbi:4'-phosphopantetheinyl transferase superfamily protein [Caulobacter sp. S45]|uniref:4'-phosphopantetheinyl transferase family protein n=1 Tax=Caulobacter sp. S45 TaxID=1641861 RepID=UPI001575D2E1|nr:4'-phosphopantetheinyl transferase superfamily protein [Caulobacter sp. S45]
MIELRWLQPSAPDEPLLMDLLDEAERARALRFQHEADRIAYAAAHALLRALLSEVAGGAPRNWRFVRSPTGKPRLDGADGGPDLRFSLSHARGMVACAVAPGIDLGVDVEPLSPMPDGLVLARASFSVREADGLQALAEPARSDAFVHLWTLKEAAHKASGQGLQDRMEHPEFEPARLTGPDPSPRPLEPCGWLFRQFRPQGRFALALAYADDARSGPVRCRPGAIRGVRT